MPAFVARAASVFLNFLCASAVAQEKKAHKSLSSVPCQKRTYKLTMMSDGFYGPPPSSSQEDKGHWDSMQYVSPAGIGVSVTTTDFKSSAAASKAFQAAVTGAMQVIERDPAKGYELPADSDRVLMMGKNRSFSIVWLHGKLLHFVNSSSLQELRNFEETVEFSCK
jgi:hypothetical protein